MPTHWKSEVPTQWKRNNCITGDSHRAKRIATDFDKEVKNIRYRYSNAGYPKAFPSHTVKSFLQKEKEKDEILIPHFLFYERTKSFVRLLLLFCKICVNIQFYR